MSMYPPLGPVEVGEWLMFSESGWPDNEFIQVERITTKLIWAGGAAFSREHGAQFDVGIYDAYLGRVRKLTDDEESGRGVVPLPTPPGEQ